MPGNAPMLEYVAPRSEARKRRSIVWTLLAIPVLFIPFVNFSCHESPVDVLWEAATQKLPSGVTAARETVLLCILAANICFGCLAFAWRVRERWQTTRSERIIAISLGAAGGLGLLVFLAVLTPDASDWEEWTSLGACFFVLIAALWLMRVMRRRGRRDAVALGALLTPFMASGVFGLVDFYSDREIGWYLVLASIPLSGIEMVSLAYAPERRRQKETAGSKPAVALTVN